MSQIEMMVIIILKFLFNQLLLCNNTKRNLSRKYDSKITRWEIRETDLEIILLQQEDSVVLGLLLLLLVLVLLLLLLLLLLALVVLVVAIHLHLHHLGRLLQRHLVHLLRPLSELRQHLAHLEPRLLRHLVSEPLQNHQPVVVCSDHLAQHLLLEVFLGAPQLQLQADYLAALQLPPKHLVRQHQQVVDFLVRLHLRLPQVVDFLVHKPLRLLVVGFLAHLLRLQLVDFLVRPHLLQVDCLVLRPRHHHLRQHLEDCSERRRRGDCLVQSLLLRGALLRQLHQLLVLHQRLVEQGCLEPIRVLPLQ
mmetsp:Transcript_925/g.1149  ORF Transcript_925/g.1149 Transcript_925/m.1149 type:complete len:306 (+) Transcript_925:894-1811(+)